MAKQFDKKFMHPTRRKLADMVFTGEYEKDTKTGWNTETVERKVGDIWEDEFNRFEQKEGYVLTTSKNSEAFQGVRDYIQEKSSCKNPECTRVKYGKADKKLIEHTGYCVDCLADIENQIRHNGVYKEYSDYKIWTRMLVEGKFKIEQLKQTHAELKQEIEYPNEDGTMEKWTLPKPVEEVKAEIMAIITNGTEELRDIEEKRQDAFEIVRKADCEQYL